MEIEQVVSIIRKSDIGNLMYKLKPANNFFGVHGLKRRPDDITFLQSGQVTDIDDFSTIRKAQTLFRIFIPKDFVIISSPKHWVIANDERAYPVSEYHLIDLDLYTYLVMAEALRLNLFTVGSTSFSSLFYKDGCQVDYTDLILQNIHKYSFILGDHSNLIPYIYKKNSKDFFAELSVEDILVAPYGVDCRQLDLAFLELNIFSNIKN